MAQPLRSQSLSDEYLCCFLRVRLSPGVYRRPLCLPLIHSSVNIMRSSHHLFKTFDLPPGEGVSTHHRRTSSRPAVLKGGALGPHEQALRLGELVANLQYGEEGRASATGGLVVGLDVVLARHSNYAVTDFDRRYNNSSWPWLAALHEQILMTTPP